MYVKCKIYRICTINVSYGICVNTCQTSKSYIKKKHNVSAKTNYLQCLIFLHMCFIHHSFIHSLQKKKHRLFYIQY